MRWLLIKVNTEEEKLTMIFLVLALCFLLPSVFTAAHRAVISTDSEHTQPKNYANINANFLDHESPVKLLNKLNNLLSNKDADKYNAKESSNYNIWRKHPNDEYVDLHNSNTDYSRVHLTNKKKTVKDRRFWFDNFLNPTKVVIPKTFKSDTLETTTVEAIGAEIKLQRRPASGSTTQEPDTLTDAITKLEETHRSLVKVLEKLTIVIEKLNLNIQVENNLKTIKALRANPAPDDEYFNSKRIKRSVPDHEENVTLIPESVISGNDRNESTTTQDGKTELDINATRRNFNEETSSENDPVTDAKLYAYIDNIFKEIQQVTTPVKNIKETFWNTDMFKIGYIIANLDTLEVNIRNLERDLDNNRIVWKGKHMVDMFNKVLLANKVVANLVEIVTEYERKYKAAINISKSIESQTRPFVL